MSNSRWFSVGLGAVAMSIASVATNAQQPGSGSDKPSPDEQQIRQAVVAFVEKYNAHNAADVAALFAADARMVFADGTEVNGREQIKQ